MRKPPRPASLVLGLAVVLIAIWRFLTCASSPPAAPSGLLATPSASPSAPAKAPPKRARSSGPAAPIALLSASAAPDEAAALGAFEGRVVSSATGQGIGGARLFLEHGG